MGVGVTVARCRLRGYSITKKNITKKKSRRKAQKTLNVKQLTSTSPKKMFLLAPIHHEVFFFRKKSVYLHNFPLEGLYNTLILPHLNSGTSHPMSDLRPRRQPAGAPRFDCLADVVTRLEG